LKHPHLHNLHYWARNITAMATAVYCPLYLLILFVVILQIKSIL
jgi:hypothetical protein